MSGPLHEYLCGLFGREQLSDCVIVFYCREGGSAATPRAITERDGRQQPEGISISCETLLNTTFCREEPAQASASQRMLAEASQCTQATASKQAQASQRKQANTGKRKQAGPRKQAQANASKREQSARLETRDGVGKSPDGKTPPGSSHGLNHQNGEPASGTEADTEPQAKRPRTSAQETAAPRDVPVGDPLPAHLVVLCGGSPRFSAQVNRWMQNQLPGSKPVLRVPLGDPGELPYALSAVRFIYTGKLDVSGAAALLQLRRLASYLQVEGCVDACDTALVGFITSGTGAAAGAGPLAGVAELYVSHHLLPDAAEERSTVQALLGACRQQLVSHGAEYGKQSGKAGGLSDAAPSLGDLLAWAFGDAPSLLSDPEVRRQMEALPAETLEALLSSDSFATDDEATVLLMLARWLEVNIATTDEARKRLCKLIRLTQLNNTYLHSVLPGLPWFPISAAEHRFLCLYVSAGTKQQARLAKLASGTYDCSTAPWYSLKARPTPSSGSTRSYEWYIPQKDLQTELAGQEPTAFVDSKQRNSIADLVANGFEWCVYICHDSGKGSAGVFLSCQLPASLRSSRAACRLAAVNPGPARVEVYKWREDGTREVAWNLMYDDSYVGVGYSWGDKDALPLAGVAAGAGAEQQGAGAAASSPDPLAAWAAYLHNREISGVVTWTQP